MAYKTVASLDADNTVQLGGVNKKSGKKNPSSIEGYYLGTRSVESRKSKTGKANIYFFQTEDGNIGVWGKTDLDRKMGVVTIGNMTRVTFSGMRSTPNGDMYTYKVETDDTNTIDVPTLTASSVSNVGDNDYTEQDSDESYISNEDKEETDGNDEDEEQEAALVAAKRKAKLEEVKQMLAKTKK